MLTNRLLPIWAGVLITIFDTFTFLFLDKYGLRRLEFFFSFLISVMAVTFGYEYFIVRPDPLEVGKGIAIPWCENCSSEDIKQLVGILGSIIMPHNLLCKFLVFILWTQIVSAFFSFGLPSCFSHRLVHSALVKSRRVDRTKKEAVKEANKYVFIESCVALGISLLINIAVTSVFATGLWGVSNNQIRKSCNNTSHESIIGEIDRLFPANNETVDADLYKAGLFLGCSFGLPAL